MPLYMDIHTVDPKTTWEEVAKAHAMDLQVQDDYDVDYLKYWYNRDCGKLFCLVEAPSAEAAHCVHREAHGLLAEKLIEVDPELLDGFMGHSAANMDGAALLPVSAPEPGRDSGIRTVMFTDIVGSTEACSLHGDDQAMAMLRTHDRVVRQALKVHGGREIKHTGDGIMAAFLSAVAAVRCACDIQRSLQDDDSGPGQPIAIRVGISAGEPVESNNDLFGSTVQLAARLCSEAPVGGVLVSNVVADLCIGKNVAFDDPRSVELKGFACAVLVRTVRLIH